MKKELADQIRTRIYDKLVEQLTDQLQGEIARLQGRVTALEQRLSAMTPR